MFMEKVLKDESLKQYRGKFPTKPKEEISREYTCVTHLRVDTTANDSAVLDESDSPEGVTLPDELTPNE